MLKERGRNMETINIVLKQRFKMDVNEIDDNTILLAYDNQGGMCDRLMKGRKGIIANANVTIQAWNDNGLDDGGVMPINQLSGTTDNDIVQALIYLEADNFTIYDLTQGQAVLTSEYVVGRNLIGVDKHANIEVVDLDKVEFSKDNLFTIL